MSASASISFVQSRDNIRLQKSIAIISFVLMLVKFAAYYITNSVAVLTDALESIVNVTAGFIGLYSLNVSARPRDRDHPYGHGKAEFVSAAVEGTLIFAAGVLIVYSAVKHLLQPEILNRLDTGMYLVGITAIVNFIAGTIAVRQGRKSGSPALLASGRHLQTDTFSTIAIIAGLLLISITGLIWIDALVAIGFAIFIIITGYKIVRRSLAGIMDEADMLLLARMVSMLNQERRSNWVDLHNLRVIKYGNVLHVDCHLTVPWYFNINQAHEEIDLLAGRIRSSFGESLELFVHNDGCLYTQCHICDKGDCPVRQHEFKHLIDWTLDNVLQNEKHEYVAPVAIKTLKNENNNDMD